MASIGNQILRAGLFLLVGLVSLSGTSCHRPVTKSLKHVTLATSTNVWCGLPLIAKNKGFFEEEKLDVEINIQDGGRYCMDALLSKSADLGNVVEINVAYVGFTGNQDIVVVGNVVTSTGMAIVASKAGGIQAPTDLNGKRFGYTPGTQGDLFAHRFFDKHKVNLNSLEMHKLQPKAIAPAIASKSIAAASTWEPFVNSCLKAMGEDAVVFRDPDAHTGYMHLAARKEWAAQNPEAMKSFLRALKKAQVFVEEHPDEAKAILAKEMSLDLDATNNIWPYFRLELTMNKKELVDITEKVGRWIHDSQDNYTDKAVPNYEPYFNAQYFEEMGTASK